MSENPKTFKVGDEVEATRSNVQRHPDGHTIDYEEGDHAIVTAVSERFVRVNGSVAGSLLDAWRVRPPVVAPSTRVPSLPEDDTARGRAPMMDGLLSYFPNALAYVAEVSKIGSEKHNVGQPMHWARGKSMDHGNKILRHQVDAGLKDAGGTRHSGYVAWRALAQLQEELEYEEGYPMSRGSKPAEYPKDFTPGEFGYTHSAAYYDTERNR